MNSKKATRPRSEHIEYAIDSGMNHGYQSSMGKYDSSKQASSSSSTKHSRNSVFSESDLPATSCRQLGANGNISHSRQSSGQAEGDRIDTTKPETKNRKYKIFSTSDDVIDGLSPTSDIHSSRTEPALVRMVGGLRMQPAAASMLKRDSRRQRTISEPTSVEFDIGDAEAEDYDDDEIDMVTESESFQAEVMMSPVTINAEGLLKQTQKITTNKKQEIKKSRGITSQTKHAMFSAEMLIEDLRNELPNLEEKVVETLDSVQENLGWISDYITCSDPEVTDVPPSRFPDAMGAFALTNRDISNFFKSESLKGVVSNVEIMSGRLSKSSKNVLEYIQLILVALLPLFSLIILVIFQLFFYMIVPDKNVLYYIASYTFQGSSFLLLFSQCVIILVVLYRTYKTFSRAFEI